MQARNRRQREALYEGAGNERTTDFRTMWDRFEYGCMRKPHTAAMLLLHDMHVHLTESTRPTTDRR